MIPVFKPYMRTGAILKALKPVLDSGWVGLGPKTEEFEKTFAKAHGKRHAVAVNSCTAALHLALRVFDIKDGDEVLVPALTFASTALAALYERAVPVFVDTDPDTLCMSPVDAERKLTTKTRAIIATNFGGGSADWVCLRSLAKRYNLRLIEDNAHGCGGMYMGHPLGTFGDIGCFSFHAVKNLPMGDGGMLLLDDDALAARLRRLRWLGIDKSTWQRAGTGYSWQYTIDELGFKYHMNDLQATVGLVQLKFMPSDNRKRAILAAAYTRGLSDLPHIKLPQVLPKTASAWHNYTIQVAKPFDRDALAVNLAKQGIATTVHYEPLHLHKVFAGRSRFWNMWTIERIWPQLLVLPMYPQLTRKDQDKVIEAIRAYTLRYA